jgi:chromosome segregation ATPase
MNVTAAKELIDEAARQVRLFLSSEAKSASVVTEGIICEENLNVKLEKFLHLVVDRLTIQENSDQKGLSKLIRKIGKVDGSAPSSSLHFSPWLIKRFGELVALEKERGRFDHCQRFDFGDRVITLSDYEEMEAELERTKSELREVRIDHRLSVSESEELKVRLKEMKSKLQATSSGKSETLIEDLKDRINELNDELRLVLSEKKSLESELFNCKEEKSDLTRRIRELENSQPDVVALKKQNSQLIREAAENHEEWNMKLRKLTQVNEAMEDDLNVQRKKIHSLKRAKNRRRLEFSAQYRGLAEQLELLGTKLADFKDTKREYRRIKEAHLGMEKKVRKLEDENAELSEKLRKVQIRLDSRTSIYEREKLDYVRQMEGDKNSLMNRMKEDEADLSKKICENVRLREEIEILSDEKRKLSLKLQELEMRISALERERSVVQSKAKEMKQEMGKRIECQGCQFDVKSLGRKFDDLEQAISDLDGSLGCLLK